MRSITFTLVCFVVCHSFLSVESFDFGNFFFGSGSRASVSPRSLSTTPRHPPTTSSSSNFTSSSSEFTSAEVVANSTEFVNASAETRVSDVASTAAPNGTTTSVVDVNGTSSSDVTTSAAAFNLTSPGTTTDGEVEEVVLGELVTHAGVVPVTKTLLQKSLDWVEDAYTLSILLPIAAGVLFASAIIVTVACCRWLRRCCRRRRFRQKVQLPDSVKNLRPSDRARLLAETSDEEY